MLARAWRHTSSSVPAISGWSARVAIRDCCCSERLLAMDRQMEAVIAAVSAPLISASSVIGKHQRNLTGGLDRDAVRDEPPGLDQHARRSALVETVALEIARALADRDQLVRHCAVDAGLVRDDFGLDGGGRIAEVHRAETLLGRFLEILENALVAGVVGDHELEIGMRAHELAALLQRQHAAVVGQRMDDDGRVLARLDDFVEIADGAVAHRDRQRPVMPDGALGVEQVAPDQVGCGHVLVAGDRDQRALELPGHVLDEARLAAAGRPLEHDRHALGISRLKQAHFIADARGNTGSSPILKSSSSILLGTYRTSGRPCRDLQPLPAGEGGREAEEGRRCL